MSATVACGEPGAAPRPATQLLDAAGQGWLASLASSATATHKARATGGSTFAVTMQIAEKAEPGSVLLCMLPDTGERYLSSPLFEGIPQYMTDDEIALMKSTPSSHMPDEE